MCDLLSKCVGSSESCKSIAIRTMLNNISINYYIHNSYDGIHLYLHSHQL